MLFMSESQGGMEGEIEAVNRRVLQAASIPAEILINEGGAVFSSAATLEYQRRAVFGRFA